MTAATGIQLVPEEANDAANQIPDANVDNADINQALPTMDALTKAGDTSGLAGNASLTDANNARDGGGAAGGAGCGADAGAAADTAAPAADTAAAAADTAAPAAT
jgi:hypothetical protein